MSTTCSFFDIGGEKKGPLSSITWTSPDDELKLVTPLSVHSTPSLQHCILRLIRLDFTLGGGEYPQNITFGFNATSAKSAKTIE